jgi:hypothetical protein
VSVRRKTPRAGGPPCSGIGAEFLAFCYVGAVGAGGTTPNEARAHLAGVQVADSGAVVTEMRVNAVGIQQTMAGEPEHGDLAVRWELSRTMRSSASRGPSVAPPLPLVLLLLALVLHPPTMQAQGEP